MKIRLFTSLLVGVLVNLQDAQAVGLCDPANLVQSDALAQSGTDSEFLSGMMGKLGGMASKMAGGALGALKPPEEPPKSPCATRCCGLYHPELDFYFRQYEQQQQTAANMNAEVERMKNEGTYVRYAHEMAYKPDPYVEMLDRFKNSPPPPPGPAAAQPEAASAPAPAAAQVDRSELDLAQLVSLSQTGLEQLVSGK